ncbi:hypothetical protein [Paenibacillus sp. GCM10023250]|uniref:hypothetical protein n=1 Tax=Paenibacillus sp. GCM10023250 TaxID=3252648 RepID=UPI0036068B0B
MALRISGGYAEGIAVPVEVAITLEPDRISEEAFAFAAAIPPDLAMILREVACVRPGYTVLVHAAAGGGGSLIGRSALASAPAASRARSAARTRPPAPKTWATARSSSATGTPKPY